LDRYSRTVAFLKVLLPLAALALLSTLFLLARNTDPTATIPFAETEIADRLRDQQITQPFYSGTTRSGNEITVTASIARPGGNGAPAEAENLNSRITLANGNLVTMRARDGSLSPHDDQAIFSGRVEIVTSTGYEIETEILFSSLSGIAAEAPGQVSGNGPPGSFTAGAMQLSEYDGDGGIHLLFKNGVKLLYDPKLRER
jgi:lipopolysaccharide export system protein LptC